MSWGFTWWGREWKRAKRFTLHRRNWPGPGPGPQPIGFTISLGYFHFFLMIWT